MRPISKGKTPLDSQGNPKVFKSYQEARGELIDKLGEYCSYCEMHLDTSLAVEHILPKAMSSFSDEEKAWENFCLACTNCNSTKNIYQKRRWDSEWKNLFPVSAKIAVRSQFFWIDRDNTFRAIEYLQGGLVRINASLSPHEQQEAQATIEMVGLNKTPLNNLERSDRRWNNRREAWEMAARALSNFKKVNTSEMQDQILDTAKAKGFWSVWMTIFKNEPRMLRRFIQEFSGTCHNCFDSHGNPVPRIGGNL